jgi:pyruvate/2-oxoglutarate dehydrogenase complex dihydrolipoamide acyltransferase (E2) component
MNWDRRVMAGAQAARFFARICELLQHPDALTAVPVSCSTD